MNSFTNGAIIEINKNYLRVLSSNLEVSESLLEPGIVNDTHIVSVDAVTSQIRSSIKDFKTKIEKVVFLIEEKDIYDRFFVVRNDEVDVSANLKSQASTFVGGSLDDLHCIFQKVSPFVYQFIGVKKDSIDNLVQISTNLKVRLEGILPTSFVFAKFVGVYDPFFFIFTGPDESTLVASEYGGVYHSDTYANSGEVHNKMAMLIKELSTFNREKPVTKVFTIGSDIEVGENYHTQSLSLPENIHMEEFKGFERLLITHTLINSDYQAMLEAYFNLRSFTPFYNITTSTTSITKYVAPALVTIPLLVLGLFIGNRYYRQNQNNNSTPEVIGVSEEQKEEVKESTPTPEANTPAFDRSQVTVRVENGAGVAGTAAKMRDVLTPLGYKVTEVGNAEEFDYEETEISIKEDKKQFLDQIKADLSSNYTIKISDKFVESSKGYDLLIIVGKK